MPYTNRQHRRRFKRKNQEAQYAQVVTCAATMLPISIIVFQTSLRDRHYLKTSGLVDPLHCFWHTLSALGRRGRPAKFIFKHAVLGCLFHSYCGTMENKTLCKIFGVPPSTVRHALANTEIVLQSALKVLPDAQIHWSSFEQQAPTKAVEQNAMYKSETPRGRHEVGNTLMVSLPLSLVPLFTGWLHLVLVTGTLCFGVDGTLVWSKHNCRGLWNKGEMSRVLQHCLADPTKTLDGYGAVADCAFPVFIGMFSLIFTPPKDGFLERASPACRPALVARSNAITSLCQAAEWGMGSATLLFRQLDQKVWYHPHVRGRRLTNIYRLNNLRVCRVGITQIGSVFGREEDLIYNLPDDLPHV
ncbi:hypothetical protein BDK51DRAFT_37286 [Blyttiomyces helicus]|uniref:DDE Tnp4 domain-containing protein n=1 Tax=Blyttiomyces helicus TaxID=388810 RepID=A0A4P9WKU9_9FUNG|nr:hypothetical protein BDK51DRAFT_37286 [Blyttiomyces helicus]|eukprot:RKO93454.1 hypothetical protein BDK51DRAFT_37286 [Blyttiomyces helicus]